MEEKDKVDLNYKIRFILKFSTESIYLKIFY